MDFEHSPRVKALQARLTVFMDEHVYPNEARFFAEVEANKEQGNGWVPTRVTIAELRMRLPNAPTANLPKNVAVWDVVDQLPSESQTLERLFDLRQVYPDAVVTTEPAGGASDSSSDAASNDPVEVVRMFVDAIDSGDPELAKSLCTPEFARQCHPRRPRPREHHHHRER